MLHHHLLASFAVVLEAFLESIPCSCGSEVGESWWSSAALSSSAAPTSLPSIDPFWPYFCLPVGVAPPGQMLRVAGGVAVGR